MSIYKVWWELMSCTCKYSGVWRLRTWETVHHVLWVQVFMGSGIFSGLQIMCMYDNATLLYCKHVLQYFTGNLGLLVNHWEIYSYYLYSVMVRPQFKMNTETLGLDITAAESSDTGLYKWLMAKIEPPPSAWAARCNSASGTGQTKKHSFVTPVTYTTTHSNASASHTHATQLSLLPALYCGHWSV